MLQISSGFPSAMISRTAFPDYSQNGSGGKAMSRGYWADASNEILNSGDTADAN
mgnify:FL=1